MGGQSTRRADIGSQTIKPKSDFMDMLQSQDRKPIESKDLTQEEIEKQIKDIRYKPSSYQKKEQMSPGTLLPSV